jgi:hypothetical protein
MTGNALIDFVIALIAIGGSVAIFFVAIPFLFTNATMIQIARIAIGVVAAVALLVALKAVLFGGGGPGINPMGIVYFAVGVIVVLVVLYLVKLVLGYANLGEWQEPILMVLGAVCLIALLLLAANSLFGVGGPLLGGTLTRTPAIAR